MERIIKAVKAQAEDSELWFKPETESEAYLQDALRFLHNIIAQEHEKNWHRFS